jgi:hypothetical protein
VKITIVSLKQDYNEVLRRNNIPKTRKGGVIMNSQVYRNTVTDKIHKQRVQSVAGTMAIEGLTLSEASRRNLDRYASGQANYQQILAELKAKYQRAE